MRRRGKGDFRIGSENHREIYIYMNEKKNTRRRERF